MDAVRKRLAVAVVASVFVLLLQIDGLVTAPYDSWTHLFFASHYLQGWFASMDMRWYLGFPVVSYPPLAHQLLAVVSLPFIRVGWDQTAALTAAYASLAVGFTCLYPLAVYSYGRVVVSKRAASYGALIASVFTGWWALMLGYGQFTTVMAAVVTLFGGWALFRALQTGRAREIILATLLTALVPMVHHFTSVSFLLAVYFIVIVSFITEYAEVGTPESNATKERLVTTVRRVAPVAVGSVVLAVLALYPFVQFLATGPTQPVIPHGSRQSWFQGAVWTRPQPYLTLFTGTLFLVLAPVGGYLAYQRGETPALVSAVVASVFGVLSLGFTTPLPQLLYPGLAETLTYFRFGAWGGFLLLPVVGSLVGVTYDREFDVSFDMRPPSRRKILFGFVAVLLISQSVISSQMTTLGAASPDRRPVAEEIGEFMTENDRWRWRYLTLGMSQELGLVGIEAPHAQTVDGNYNTGRLPSNVPTLARSRAAQISSAKFSPAGRRVLNYYLANNKEYGIKFVFSVDSSYRSELREHGFEVRYDRERPDVRVWYDPDTPPALASKQPPARGGDWRMYLWGALPLATLCACLLSLTSLFVTEPVPSDQGRE